MVVVMVGAIAWIPYLIQQPSHSTLPDMPHVGREHLERVVGTIVTIVRRLREGRACGETQRCEDRQTKKQTLHKRASL
jgi:hypothetical protein